MNVQEIKRAVSELAYFRLEEYENIASLLSFKDTMKQDTVAKCNQLIIILEHLLNSETNRDCDLSNIFSAKDKQDIESIGLPTQGIDIELDLLNIMKSKGVSFSKDSLNYKRLKREYIRSYIAYLEVFIARLEGNYEKCFSKLYTSTYKEEEFDFNDVSKQYSTTLTNYTEELIDAGHVKEDNRYLSKKEFYTLLNNATEQMLSKAQDKKRVIEKTPVKKEELEPLIFAKYIEEYKEHKLFTGEWNLRKNKYVPEQYKRLKLLDFLTEEKNLRNADKRWVLNIRDNLIKVPTKHNGKKKYMHLSFKQLMNLKNVPYKDLRSEQNVKKHIETLHGFFEWMINTKGLLETNYAVGVAKGIKLPKSGKRGVRTYKANELQKIFSHEIFTTKKEETLKNEPHNYWIPLIGLYHGMRLSEITQLFKSDINIDASVPYIKILVDDEGNKLDDNEEQRVKRESSKRIIPLHPFLLKLGFDKYIKEELKTKEKTLWSKLRTTKSQNKTDAFSKWYTDFKTEYVINSTQVDFHSFRRNFANELKQAQVDSTLKKELMGHVVRDLTDGCYPDEYNLRIKQDGISKVGYQDIQRILLKE